MVTITCLTTPPQWDGFSPAGRAARALPTPLCYHATYRGIAVIARLLAGGYSVTVPGYAGARLVALTDPELVLAGRLDVQPIDTRPIWQIVADPATYEGTYGRDMIRGR